MADTYSTNRRGYLRRELWTDGSGMTLGGYVGRIGTGRGSIAHDSKKNETRNYGYGFTIENSRRADVDNFRGNGISRSEMYIEDLVV